MPKLNAGEFPQGKKALPVTVLVDHWNEEMTRAVDTIAPSSLPHEMETVRPLDLLRGWSKEIAETTFRLNKKKNLPRICLQKKETQATAYLMTLCLEKDDDSKNA